MLMTLIDTLQQKLSSPSSSSHTANRVQRLRRRRRPRRLRHVITAQEAYEEHKQWVTQRQQDRRKATIRSTLIYKKVILKSVEDQDVESAVQDDTASILSSEKPSMYTDKGDLLISETNITEEDDETDSDDVATCAICLQRFEGGDDICWSHHPECFHGFHSDCMHHWLIRNDECPCCRTNYLVSPVSIKPNEASYCCDVESNSDDETEETSSVDSNETSVDGSLNQNTGTMGIIEQQSSVPSKILAVEVQACVEELQ